MDFSYSEFHTDIQRLANELLTDYSDAERLKKLEAKGPYLDHEVWQKINETGLNAAALPEALGGMGMDFHAVTLVAEAIGKTVVSTPFIPCIASCAVPLLAFVSTPGVPELLTAVGSGKKLLVAALLEPGNEDPFRASAQVNSDGSLTGTKYCVPFAADADTLMVACQKDGAPAVALVQRAEEGVTLLAQHCTANEPQYQVSFKQAKCATLFTGEEARELLQRSIAMTTVAYCAMAGGLADRMTRISGEYTSQRKQFGVAIATFQAVAHRLADCYIDAQCLQIATLKAASDIASGDIDNDSISMAKTWCGNVMHRVSQAAQHVHGGAGIDRDYHLFRFCLWAKQLELSLGNSRQHLSRLADRLEVRYLQSAVN